MAITILHLEPLSISPRASTKLCKDANVYTCALIWPFVIFCFVFCILTFLCDNERVCRRIIYFKYLKFQQHIIFITVHLKKPIYISIFIFIFLHFLLYYFYKFVLLLLNYVKFINLQRKTSKYSISHILSYFNYFEHSTNRFLHVGYPYVVKLTCVVSPRPGVDIFILGHEQLPRLDMKHVMASSPTLYCNSTGKS